MTQEQDKVLGFWASWSLTVGIMIGSGVFLLPAVLAPYGLMSFSGWILTALGSILLSLVFARLAGRTNKSGGVYVYTRNAFGNLPAFIIAWGYWTSYWIAIPAIAIAFVGYLSIFIPAINEQAGLQLGFSMAIMWAAIFLNAKGLKEAATFQLLMTLLKLVPLLFIIVAGFLFGSSDNMPAANPKELSLIEGLAATALLTMWAFSGMEAGTVPAGAVKNAEKNVPRAIVLGTITVAFVYIASTAAVMLLVPAEQLMNSPAPFADAAAVLGSWGPPIIAIGAMISTAGALNGTVFVAGQMPMAVALDGLAPKVLGKSSKGGGPIVSLGIILVLTSALLLSNFSRGLIGAFTFLAMMSTLAFMLPLIICSLAEFLHSWKSAKAWSAVAALALIYSAFAMFGSSFSVLAWGALLMACGVPLYYLGKQKQD